MIPKSEGLITCFDSGSLLRVPKVLNAELALNFKDTLKVLPMYIEIIVLQQMLQVIQFWKVIFLFWESSCRRPNTSFEADRRAGWMGRILDSECYLLCAYWLGSRWGPCNCVSYCPSKSYMTLFNCGQRTGFWVPPVQGKIPALPPAGSVPAGRCFYLPDVRFPRLEHEENEPLLWSVV